VLGVVVVGLIVVDLVALAAEKLGVPVRDLKTDNGFVLLKSAPSSGVSYADLIGDSSFSVTLDGILNPPFSMSPQ